MYVLQGPSKTHNHLCEWYVDSHNNHRKKNITTCTEDCRVYASKIWLPHNISEWRRPTQGFDFDGGVSKLAHVSQGFSESNEEVEDTQTVCVHKWSCYYR